jgi:hypothetical protein
MATTRRSAASARARGRRALAPPVLFASLLAAAGVLVCAFVSGFPAEVEADAATSVDVETDPQGAHVVLDRDLAWVEAGGSAPQQNGHGGGCVRRWVPAPAPIVMMPAPGAVDPGPAFLGPPPSADATPYFVYCGTTYLTTIWAAPTQFNGGNIAVALRALAEHLVHHLPFPDAGIEISPGERGLTGLESWFWVTGYDGAPLVASVSGFGTTVTVEARASGATWDFGDGTAGVVGLGLPYPARSTVTHVYERRSGRDGLAVTVHFEFAVRYRVDNGPWQGLAPVSRRAERSYAVDEARAQLVPSSP